MDIVKILIAILAVLIIGSGVIVGNVYYQQQQHDNLVANQLQGNSIAHKIADEYNIPVKYEELGQDGNGYTVCGQTQWTVYSDGSEQLYCVILDDDIDPNSYEAHAILAHELGHIVLGGGTEAQADEYAASLGYEIVDAYHGVH